MSELDILENEAEFRCALNSEYENGATFREAIEDLEISEGSEEYRAAAQLWGQWLDEDDRATVEGA